MGKETSGIPAVWVSLHRCGHVLATSSSRYISRPMADNYALATDAQQMDGHHHCVKPSFKCRRIGKH